MKSQQVDRYRLLEELGRGAFGVVYRAHDLVIDRVVALKTVSRPGPTSEAQEQESYDRFLQEARAAGKLTHPNVVMVYDVGEDAEAGVSFIAMEYVAGETLDRYYARRHRFDHEQVRAFGHQIASALVVAHAAGIVHRDIKPANLILANGVQVKVADFGIAKMISSSLTRDGSFIGSPNYMSPEQVRGVDIDHRSDLFSLGIVLFELTTGQQAFPGKNVYEVIQRVINHELPPPNQVRSDVPQQLNDVIVRALKKDRDARFQSAAELLSCLEPAGAPLAPAIPRGALLVDVLADDLAVPSAVGPPGRPVQRSAPPPAAPLPAAPPAVSEAVADVAHLEPGPTRSISTAARATPRGDASKAVAPTSAESSARRPRGAARALAVAVAVLGAAGAWTASRRVVVEPVVAVVGSSMTPTPAPIIHSAVAAMLEPDPPIVSVVPTAVAATPTPRPTPPPEVSVATPTPIVVAATPTPLPFPFVFQVRHDHVMGDCRGSLMVYADRIVYDSSDRDVDDRDWSYAAIVDHRFEDGELTIVALDGGSKQRKYRFDVQGGAIPGELAAHMAAHLPGVGAKTN